MPNEPIFQVEFYRIQSAFNGYLLRPRDPNDPGSDIIQGLPTGNQDELAYQWGFVQLGTNLYRIFNAMSGFCIATTKAEIDVRLQQFGWNQFVHQWVYKPPVDPNQPPRVKFLSPNPNLAWSNAKQNQLGAEIYLLPVENALHEEWLLSRVVGVEVGEAAQGAAG